MINNINFDSPNAPLPRSLTQNWPDSSPPQYAKTMEEMKPIEEIIEEVDKALEGFIRLMEIVKGNKTNLISNGQILHDGLVRLLAEISSITSTLVISYQLYAGLRRLVEQLEKMKREMEEIPWN